MDRNAIEQQCVGIAYSDSWIIQNIVPCFHQLYSEVTVIEADQRAIIMGKALSHMLQNKSINCSLYSPQIAALIDYIVAKPFADSSPSIKEIALQYFTSLSYGQHFSSVLLQMQRLFGISIMLNCSKFTAKKLLVEYPEVIPQWKKLTGNSKQIYNLRTTKYIAEILESMLSSLASINRKISEVYEGEQEMKAEDADKDTLDTQTQVNIEHCEAIATLLVSVGSCKYVRPFIKHFIQDKHLFVLYKCSVFKLSEKSNKLTKLLKYLRMIVNSDHENNSNDEELATTTSFYEKVAILKDLVTKKHFDKFTVSSSRIVGKICERKNLLEILDALTEEELNEIYSALQIPAINIKDIKDVNYNLNIRFIKHEIIISFFQKSKSLYDYSLSTGIFPVNSPYSIEFPMEYYHSTLHSICSRQFIYFSEHLSNRLRKYISVVTKDISYELDKSKNIIKIINSHPNAVKIDYFSMSHIRQPLIGELFPAEVRADFGFNIGSSSDHWKQIKIGDFLYLCSLDEKKNVSIIRGCQILRIYNSKSEDIEDPDTHAMKDETDGSRAIHAMLDSIQYKYDTSSQAQISYNNLQIAIIVDRDLKLEQQTIILLKKLLKENNEPNLLLTQLLLGHHKASISSKIDQSNVLNSLKLHDLIYSEDCYNKVNSLAPYLGNALKSSEYKESAIKYTPEQIVTIASILSEGITPINIFGSKGKKASLIKALELIYNNSKDRMVVVFKNKKSMIKLVSKLSGLEKVAMLGREQKGFSQYYQVNRVDSLLKRRLVLMRMFLDLAFSIDIKNFPEYICERALCLYNFVLLPKWNQFINEYKSGKVVSEIFPFKSYFSCLNPQLFSSDNNDQNFKTASECWDTVASSIADVKECQPLEIIRDYNQRIKYILGTCTRVLLTTASTLIRMRDQLIEGNIYFDSCILYNAEQISELQGMVPLTLTTTRIKRLVAIAASPLNYSLGYSIYERIALDYTN